MFDLFLDIRFVKKICFLLCFIHFSRFMVGLGGLEPPASRLSGVRSNHLSYKPMIIHGYHETVHSAGKYFLRKEVIQPQVLLRLPCYDFTPVIGFALGNLFLDQLRAPPTSMV